MSKINNDLEYFFTKYKEKKTKRRYAQLKLMLEADFIANITGLSKPKLPK